MKYRGIAHTPFSPSVICLGTGPFGTALDEVSSFELLDTFYEKGGNFLDTAHSYGAWGPRGVGPGGVGLSERVIGRWLKERGLREHMILGTKGAHPDLATPHISRVTHNDIVSDLDESLQCLQTESIDLYWLHRDNPTQPVADLLETLSEQVNKGKIRYFGCSNWRVDRIRAAMQYATEHGLAGFVGNQLMWSLASPNADAIEDKSLVFMDTQALEFHRRTGQADLAYTSQAHGYFSKLNDPATPLPDGLRTTYDTAENRQRFSRLQTVSQELSLALPTVVLAYLTNQAFPTFPITGSRNKQQLLENLQAGDVVLGADTLGYLENSLT
jgi:aryl-alcohol dehydrogenase-like predicted oxidoreductase